MTIYIVRILNIHDYGVYNLLVAIMAYIGLFSSLGLLNIFKRFIPEWLHQKNFNQLILLVKNGLLLRGALIILLLAITIVFAPQISKLFNISYSRNLFLMYSFGIFFYLESQLLGLALTSLFMHKYFAFAQVAYSILRAMIVYFLLQSGMALRGLVLGEVIGFLILVSLQYYYYNRFFVKKHSNIDNTNLPFKRLMRYGGFAYVNEMGEQVLDVSTDFLIISAFLGTQMVGLYAFATQTVKIMSRWMPHRLLLDVITPYFFTRYAHSKDDEDLVWLFSFLIKIVFFFFIPFVALILLLGDQLIRYVYDIKYLDALQVMGIAAIFSALNAFEMPLGLVIQAKERVEIHFYSKIFSIYNLVGNLLVIKPFGIVGIALVTSSAILFKNIFTFYKIKKTISLNIPWQELIKIVFNSLLMCILIWFIRSIVDNTITLILTGLIAAIFYSLISICNKVFAKDERNLINRLIGRSVFYF